MLSILHTYRYGTNVASKELEYILTYSYAEVTSSHMLYVELTSDVQGHCRHSSQHTEEKEKQGFVLHRGHSDSGSC